MEHLGINSSNYFLYWRWGHECPRGACMLRPSWTEQCQYTGHGPDKNLIDILENSCSWIIVSIGSKYYDKLTFNLDHLKGAGQLLKVIKPFYSCIKSPFWTQKSLVNLLCYFLMTAGTAMASDKTVKRNTCLEDQKMIKAGSVPNKRLPIFWCEESYQPFLSAET